MNPALTAAAKKYKKCCIHTIQPQEESAYVYTDLDELSNQVSVLIEQKKFDETEEVCQKLMAQYPEQIEGLYRYAELFEAQEEKQKATIYYRKVADFAEQAEGFDPESGDFFREKAGKLAENDTE